MIAAKFGDPVVGVDIHLVLVPTPAGPVPTPLPHPFLGVVWDPLGALIGAAIGKVAGSGSAVFVNMMPCGNTGMGVRGASHVPTPPGTSFVAPDAPSNHGTLVTGSKTVHFMGSSESRTTSMVSSCSFPLNLPTSVCLAVPGGPPVNIGGPEALDVLAAVLAAIRVKWLSDALHDLLSKYINNKALRWVLSKIICALTGHPVDVMTGELIADAIDFELPGAIPIVWERNYRSRQTRKGSLGPAWTHPFDDRIELTAAGTRLWLADGRPRDLPALAVGEQHWDPLDRFTLERTSDGYEVVSWDGVRRVYARVEGQRDLVPVEVRDRAANSIVLAYERGYLVTIRDTAGRDLTVRWTDEGRMEGVYFEDAPLVRYRYGADGMLAAALDALGHAMAYAYDGGVMVKEVRKSGVAFHFEWDWAHPEGWCIRTWGETPNPAVQPGDPQGVPRFIYDRRINYDAANHFTSVENSRGGVWKYWGDERGIVVKEQRPAALAPVTYTYDEWFRKTSQTDEEGRRTEWEFDARGNCVCERDALGLEWRSRYNELNQVVEAIDEAGGVWKITWASCSKPAAVESPAGVATLYSYDERGRLLEMHDPMGRRGRYRWDDAHNLVARLDGENRQSTFRHDARGLIREARDPGGRTARFARDAIGQITSAELENGEKLRNTFDAEGRLVEQTDSRGRVTRMAWAGTGKLIETVDARGGRVRFAYDGEESLVAVENEHGERVRFELDPGGRVKHLLGYDGKKVSYFYDKSDKLARVVAPDYCVTTLERDAAGRIVKRVFRGPPGPGQTGTLARVEEETFAWTPRGELSKVTGGSATVVFDRDVLGRVTREGRVVGDGEEHHVSSRYDYSGQRIERETDLGHQAAYSYNGAGELTGLRADLSRHLGTPEVHALGLPLFALPPWEVQLRRDALGLEAARRMPGGVADTWKRDEFARPVQQELIGGAFPGAAPRELAHTEYRWDGPDELVALTERGRGATFFEYDAAGGLIGARFADGSSQVRNLDLVGQIFRTPEKVDRRYARGGRLEWANGVEYKYDGHGNLVEKVLADGARWRYLWTISGRLASVERPDGKRVTFSYDAFGRRVTKEFDGRVTEYMWDGDTLVHERAARDGAAEPLVTWIFEPGSFSPSGKFEGRRRYSMIRNHMDTVRAVVDEAGELAWSAQLDLFGVPRLETSSLKPDAATDNPWRYPGQYEDAETGLYYNRWRYYDPEMGGYISEDPIGVRGDISLYRYVSNPLAWSDPYGLIEGGGYAPTRASNDGGEVHHTPAKASYANNPDPNVPNPNSGPSVWMEKADHRDTASCGSSAEAAKYQAEQQAHIDNGEWWKATQMDVKDMVSKFGSKYKQGIEEMLAKTRELGLINKRQENRLKNMCK